MTSRPLSMRRRQVKNWIRDSWSHHCFYRSEKQILTLLYHSLIRIQASRNRLDATKENQVKIRMLRMVLNWKGKRFCPNKEIFKISSKEKLIKPSEEKMQHRRDCPKHSLNWTDKSGKVQNTDRALCESSIQLQSQKRGTLSSESTGLINPTGKKSWLCNELEMRNRTLKSYQEMEEFRRNCRS